VSFTVASQDRGRPHLWTPAVRIGWSEARVSVPRRCSYLEVIDFLFSVKGSLSELYTFYLMSGKFRYVSVLARAAARFMFNLCWSGVAAVD